MPPAPRGSRISYGPSCRPGARVKPRHYSHAISPIPGRGRSRGAWPSMTSDARRFDLVIFDCDGVLVDSERLTNGVFAQMLNELGVAVTLDDMFEAFVGHS